MSIPNYKDIMDLLKKGLTIEAQEKIMELREAAIELQEDNLKLREKVSQLEAQIKRSKDLRLENESYRLENDPVPFCQVCYDNDKKLIHLLDAKQFGREWKCPICKGRFGGEFKIPGRDRISIRG